MKKPTQKRKRVLQGVAALAIAFLLLGWMTRDMRIRSAMVGRWHCAPYYHSDAATLYFLENGRYALFDGPGKDARFESGSWDVANGELLQIEDPPNGGATHGQVRLEWTTLVMGAHRNTICKRVDDGDD